MSWSAARLCLCGLFVGPSSSFHRCIYYSHLVSASYIFSSPLIIVVSSILLLFYIPLFSYVNPSTLLFFFSPTLLLCLFSELLLFIYDCILCLSASLLLVSKYFANLIASQRPLRKSVTSPIAPQRRNPRCVIHTVTS